MLNLLVIDDRINERPHSTTFRDLLSSTPQLDKHDGKIINENLGFKISSMVGRGKFILIKLDHFRAMLFPDRIYLFLSRNSTINDRINQFAAELKEALRQGSKDGERTPFVLQVLGELFRHVNDSYRQQVDQLCPEISRLNDTLNTNGNGIGRNIKSSIFRAQKEHMKLHFKLKDIYEILHEFSSEKDEEKIEELLIDGTQAVMKPQLFDLIDTYATYFEEMVEEMDQMEELLSFIVKLHNINVLETQNSLTEIQNRLTRFGIYLNILTVAISLGNIIPSSFGMNLDNHLNYRHSFLATNLIIVGTVATVASVASCYFRRISRELRSTG